MNIKQKLAAAATAVVATPAAFAQAVPADAVADVTSAINANMASATGIVITAGLALIGLSFVGFVLRKGRRAANGRI